MSTPLSEARPARRVPVRTLGALSVSVLALPLGAARAEAATYPYPKPPVTLPSALDVAPPYQKGTMCLTYNQPGAVAYAKMLNATYGSHVYGILRTCAAEHGEGRAVDWMLNANDPAQLALGNAITRWLAAPDSKGRPGAMAKRLGINYIIWNRQQWRAYDPGRGWAPYYGVSPHTDHIHTSFNWDGARMRSSWWSGVAVTNPLTGPTYTPPPPVPTITASGYPLLVQGATGPDVILAQKVIGVTADGRFGPITAAALGSWQSRHGVAATQKLDNATWTKMVALGLIPPRTNPLAQYVNTVLKLGSTGAAVKALQGAIGGLSVDGSYGPLTEARVKEYQKSKGLTVTGVTDAKVWNALMGKTTTTTPTTTPTTTTNPLTKYVGITLRLWSKGEAVSALQKAIGGLTVDGSYGPLTEARVKEYQKSKNLLVTGVTDAKVWNALIAGTPAPTTTTTTTSGSTVTSLSTEFTAYKSTVLRLGSTGTAVKVLQRGLGGLVVDGSFGPMTQSAVKAFQTSRGLSATGVVDAATWNAVERKVHPLLPYWGTVLKRGSTGTAVKALQKGLRVTVDGSFGPVTEAAVKAVQLKARLTQTGVVGTLTWKAVEAQMPR